MQAALPELPQLYVPDVDALDRTCTTVQDSKQGIRLIEVVGAPGRGALTLIEVSAMVVFAVGLTPVTAGRQADCCYSRGAACRHDLTLGDRILCTVSGTRQCAPLQVLMC